ncbi:MAG: SsrA-binding protein SmpB [Clostridia bacterium]|nr:SsrA-binding protein SmpB [Clostridia bacterium]
MAEKKPQRLVAENRKAYHDYFVDERYEAGIELFGTEVKSIRCGQVNLKDSYCEVRSGELWVVGFRVSPYEQGNIFNRDPMREKRLLMHKREIMKLHGLISQKGYTLVPLKIYFVGARLKMEIGLCRGKKLYDKRETEAKKESSREIERTFRSSSKYD